MNERMVDCCDHGRVLASFVCTHTLESLADGEARGFLWTRDGDGCVNAWCEKCEAFKADNGGNWNEITEKFADISLVCEACASRVASMNGIKELAQ